MSLGPHKLEYEVIEGWEHLPEGYAFTEIVGVAVDSRDRVYVFNRGDPPVIVFDKEGIFLDAWGAGQFVRPHGAYISRDDRLFLVDDWGHTVYIFSTEGKLLSRIGDGEPADTGYERGATPVSRAAGPFNNVTNVAVNAAGEVYAADGYGNARVHKFSPQGELLLSWGEPGSGEGQFNLPHGIAIDSAGRVYVADRENSRVQIFTPQGEFIQAWNWPNRPTDIFIDDQDTIYIAELGFVFGNPPGVTFLKLMRHPPEGHDPIARVTITNPDGEIIQQVGGENPVLPGNFVAPHGLWVDSRGDLYVGEVVHTTGAVKDLAPFKPATFRKFQRSG